MNESSGGTTRSRTVAQAHHRARGRHADVGFDIDGMRKDLRTMAELARTLGVELPVTATALES